MDGDLHGAKAAFGQPWIFTQARALLDGYIAAFERADAALLEQVLRTDATLLRYPDRFDDPRGRAMVATLERLLPEPATRAVA